MPNQLIISMSGNYPFGACQMPEKENNEVLVRKHIITGNKDDHISKAKLLKKLKIPHSIQIISILEDLQSLQVYYEYVPVKFQIWMKNMSDYLSDNLVKQLYILTTFLAQNKINTVFQPNHLGLDKYYHIKYFLDLENTFYNEFQNSSTLKQKYYRQINRFIKSFNSNNDKNLSNPLFQSLNSVRTQHSKFINSSIRSLPRTLNRTLSFTTLSEDYQTETNITESSDNEIPQNYKNAKQSALKKTANKNNFNQKLKNIKQKIDAIKQNGSKIHFISMQLNIHDNKDEITTKNDKIQQNPVQSRRISRGVSIDKLIKKSQKVNCSLKKNSQKGSESEKQSIDANSSFVKPQDKKNKSERFKTPKNSESPVEYLDIVKSASVYVQDFLNVLQDSSESQDNSFSEEMEDAQKQTGQQRGQKGLMKTQQSQNQNQNQDSKWRARFEAVIENSKKLIDRMKSPPKPMEGNTKT